MKKLFAPNYTQIPNDLLDSMAELSDAELRVALVVARQTFGWQRETAVITQTFLAQASGHSARSCSVAGTTLVEKGLLSKTETRRGNVFRLVVENLPDVDPVKSEPGMTEDHDEAAPGMTLGNDQQPPGHDPRSCPGMTLGNDPILKKGLKKSPTGSGEASPPNAAFRFVSLWSRDYIVTFNRPYVRSKGDFAAAKKLCASLGKQPEEIIHLARLAWSKAGPQFWNCKNKSQTVVAFCSRFNEIATELAGDLKRGAAPDEPRGPEDFEGNKL